MENRPESIHSHSERTQRELIALFADRLQIHVPSQTTDLFESGLLDSQKFVELLVRIEEQFSTKIEIGDFEIDNFRSVEKIAHLICVRKSA